MPSKSGTSGKIQKNMRLEAELVTRLSDWADKQGITYVAATERAMRAFLDEQDGEGAPDAPAVPGEDVAGRAELAADTGSIADSETLRELMAANAQLTARLGEAQKNANDASRNLLAATMQIKSLPSADEVDAKERVARAEGINEGLERGRAEREREIADLGLMGYLSWRRGRRAAGPSQE